jgi:hypothetical protein
MSDPGTNAVEEPAELQEPALASLSSRARDRFTAAMTTGSLATIATGGALIGLGLREDDVGRVFRLAGRGVLGRLGVASQAVPLTAVAVGYLHHLAVASLWGFCLAFVVLPLRGVTRIGGAVIMAAIYTWLSMGIIPAALRIGYSVTSSIPSAVSIGVSLAVALLGGIWLSARSTEG